VLFSSGANGAGFLARFPVAGGTASGIALGASPNSILPAAIRVSGAAVLLAGKFQGSVVAPGLPATTAVGGTDGFLLSVPSTLASPANFFLRFGGALEEDSNDLVVAKNGDVFIGGRYFSTDFAFGSTALAAGSGGGYQGFVGKAVGMTTPSATAYVSSTGNVSVTSLQTDDAQSYLISGGTYNGLATFAPGVTSTSLQAQAGFITRRPF